MAEDAQSLGTTATRGYLWANLGLLTRFGVALVLASVLARSLSSEEYSAMVALTVVMLYTDTALDLGMGASLIYEQERGHSHRVHVAFTANSAFGVVLAVVAVLLSPLIAGLFGLEQYVPVFMMLGPLIVLTGLNTVPWALFTRDLAFKPRAFTELFRDGSRLVVTVLLVVVADMGIWGVVWGFMASRLAWNLGTWVATRFRPVLAWDTKVVKELYAFAWRMAGNKFLGLLALNGDYFVVGNRRHDQYASYYQAFRLPEFVMGAQLNGLSAVLFPMYSRIRSDGPEALRQGMYKALRIVALFSFPVGAGLALVARDAFTVFYGTSNAAGIQTMEVISIAGAITGLGFATGDLLMAINRPGVLLRLNAVMVPLMLSSMWIVSPYGIVWVATVHLVIQIVFVGARQLIVDHMVESPTSAALACLVPGLVVTAGIVAFALPVRLLSDEGFLSLVAIGLAGTLGGLASLALYPPARHELTDLVAKLRGR